MALALARSCHLSVAWEVQAAAVEDGAECTEIRERRGGALIWSRPWGSSVGPLFPQPLALYLSSNRSALLSVPLHGPHLVHPQLATSALAIQICPHRTGTGYRGPVRFPSLLPISQGHLDIADLPPACVPSHTHPRLCLSCFDSLGTSVPIGH